MAPPVATTPRLSPAVVEAAEVLREVHTHPIRTSRDALRILCARAFAIVGDGPLVFPEPAAAAADDDDAPPVGLSPGDALQTIPMGRASVGAPVPVPVSAAAKCAVVASLLRKLRRIHRKYWGAHTLAAAATAASAAVGSPFSVRGGRSSLISMASAASPHAAAVASPGGRALAGAQVEVPTMEGDPVATLGPLLARWLADPRLVAPESSLEVDAAGAPHQLRLEAAALRRAIHTSRRAAADHLLRDAASSPLLGAAGEAAVGEAAGREAEGLCLERVRALVASHLRSGAPSGEPATWDAGRLVAIVDEASRATVEARAVAAEAVISARDPTTGAAIAEAVRAAGCAHAQPFDLAAFVRAAATRCVSSKVPTAAAGASPRGAAVQHTPVRGGGGGGGGGAAGEMPLPALPPQLSCPVCGGGVGLDELFFDMPAQAAIDAAVAEADSPEAELTT